MSLTSTTAAASAISSETRYVAPSDPSMPKLAIQITRLVGSYMLWVGVTEGPPEEVHAAPLKGSLARDWACAMPPTSANVPATGTSLLKASSSDLALSMAQRLARRFKKQIFLAVDVPPTFMALGQGARLVLEVERGLVEALKAAEVPG